MVERPSSSPSAAVAVKVSWPAWKGTFRIVVSPSGGLKTIMLAGERERERWASTVSNASPHMRVNGREFPFLGDKTIDRIAIVLLPIDARSLNTGQNLTDPSSSLSSTFSLGKLSTTPFIRIPAYPPPVSFQSPCDL
jgi:hypothetical protein